MCGSADRLFAALSIDPGQRSRGECRARHVNQRSGGGHRELIHGWVRRGDLLDQSDGFALLFQRADVERDRVERPPTSLPRQTGRDRSSWLTLEDGSLVVTGNYLKVGIPPGRPRNEWIDVRITGADPLVGEIESESEASPPQRSGP